MGQEDEFFHVDFEQRRIRDRLKARLFDADEPTRLGRYEVLELIGSGASSHVYLARDPELDRRVAIKLLRQTGNRDGWRERFVREGRALASLSHPNVLQVFEIGTHDNELFLAMEYVQGRDLRAWLAEESRGWEEVVAVMSAAALGLAAAHEHGLVHRDIKPANVLIDHEERVRVGDFGLVQPAGASDQAKPGSAAPTTLTRTGAAVGSPAYMSPEQWKGGTIDARSDQFGFCVTFFEALHGQRPFQASSEVALVQAVNRSEVQSTQDAVPDWLDSVVRRGLSANPEERFADMPAFIDALERRVRSAEHVATAEAALEALAGRSAQDSEAFASLAATASVALSSALDAWPDNKRAREARDRLLEVWFEHDLEQGALDAAAAHLVGLPGRDDLALRLNEARTLATEKAERLAKLKQLEHDADPNVALEFKVRTLLLQAPLWALVFWGLGEATRAGWIHAGHLAAVFAGHIVITIVALRVRPDVWSPNRVARRVIEIGMTNEVGTLLMLLYAWLTDFDLATSFLFVQLMLTAFWLGASVVFDRSMVLVAFVALLTAVFMHYVPSYAVDAYGVATAVALAGLAWSWARGKPEDGIGDAPPKRGA